MLRILNDFKKLLTQSSQRQFWFGFIQVKADPGGFKFVENLILAIDMAAGKRPKEIEKFCLK